MDARHCSVRTLGAIVLLAALVSLSAVRAEPLPVLMVIANQDFWYQEYAKVRKGLAARALPVVVAAARRDVAIPQDAGSLVTPDVILSEAASEDYSAVVFVGGWRASSYQYAFSGTYANAAYRPDPLVADAVNRLIGGFVEQTSLWPPSPTA